MKMVATIAAVATVSLACLVYGLTEGRRSGLGVSDLGAPAVTVRLLDVGQGDATYIRNGDSRIVIDGGPKEGRFGELLDSLGLNNKTIDVVILTHQHYDHYNGLLALFQSRRHIKVRYFFEDKDPSSASTIRRLRDSVAARVLRGELIYRSTDDPCGNGSAVCKIAMKGGAHLDIMRPLGGVQGANNRSVAVKLVGADSSSFTMWLAGDAEHDAIRYFEQVGYNRNPGMRVNVLKANHHGSCNGVSVRYLELLRPEWVVASVGGHNEYGHMHEQAKAAYRTAGVPWYRTDQNGTVTIRSPGTIGGGYTVSVARAGKDMDGPSDRRSRQRDCDGM